MTTLPAQNTTSISRPIEPIDRGLSDLVTSIVNVVEMVDGQAVAPRVPSQQLRKLAAVRLADVRRALAPLGRAVAEKERAGRAVAAMLGGWINARAADPAAKVAAYVTALADLPCWAVEQVCQDVARGRVEGLDPAYPPSAAQLHQLCEEALRRLRKEAADLALMGSVKLLEHQPSAEERVQLRTKLMGLRDRLDRGGEAEEAARLRVRTEHNAAELARQQDRVRAEYAAKGLTPPSPLALSITARKDMQERDLLPAGAHEEAGE